MNRYKDQKEMSLAMNGKLLLMLLGVMLVFTAVTSTAQYGANMFMIAAEVAKGTETTEGTEKTEVSGETEPAEKAVVPGETEPEEKAEVSGETEPAEKTEVSGETESAEKADVSETTEVSEETEEIDAATQYANALAEIGMSLTMARVTGVVFFIVGIVEAFIGVCCIILQNRLDKSFFTRKLVLILLVVEVVSDLYLLAVKLVSPSRIFTSLAMPLFLLWAVSKLCKLAKLYPDRVYALDPQKKAAPKQAAPKKSLRERAMVPQTDETEQESPDETRKADE